jgi:hypothetical protein
MRLCTVKFPFNVSVGTSVFEYRNELSIEIMTTGLLALH